MGGTILLNFYFYSLELNLIYYTYTYRIRETSYHLSRFTIVEQPKKLVFMRNHLGVIRKQYHTPAKHGLCNQNKWDEISVVLNPV